MGDSDELSRPSSPEMTESSKKDSSMNRYFLIKVLYKSALIFLGYGISYMQWSVVLLFVTAGTLIWLENRDTIKANKIKVKATACSYSKQDLIKRIDEIPSWVKFPDRERAEWLNQVITQLWPTLSNYIVKIFRTSIQNKIRKKHENFLFESIDFGDTPPKIDGIKVYNSASTADSIIIDFDVFYDGNCDINFSLSGHGIGGLRDFQLSVEVRVVLKPLLLKMPLIGGIQVYFLNTPDISFTLEGLSSIPGLSSFIRTKIEERITKLIVFPNKITKRFSKSVEPSELKSLEPAGVLRVHVFEARDLMAKDITGKSDPYAILYVGAQECRTNIINQSLNPKWDYWCEFVIIDPMSQHLGFKLYDKDNVNEDDFLGSGDADISTVIKGHTDQWFQLDNAKHGSIHLRFTWLTLSPDIGALEAISKETKLLQVATISTALLIMYVEVAQNLPEAKRFIKPHPYFIASVGEKKQKSKVKKHTVDPAWESGFLFLVQNPNQDSLHMAILDKQSGSLLTQFSYKIANLIQEPNLQFSKKEFPMECESSKIVISLQLRILTKEIILDEDDSDTDSEELSRQSSVSDTSAPNSPDKPTLKLRSSFRNSPKREVEETFSNKNTLLPNDAAPQSPFNRSISASSSGEFRLGKLELGINYSEPRQKLIVTVHQISNLPLNLKDPSDIPDPYVKIKLFSNGQTVGSTHRTKVKMDCCNPVYDENFEYLCSKAEAYELKLFAEVKTKKFFNNNTMGQVEVNLKYVNLSEPYRAWFDLYPKQSS